MIYEWITKKAREEGYARGREEGRKEMAEEILINLMEEQVFISRGTASDVTGLPMERLNDVIDEYRYNKEQNSSLEDAVRRAKKMLSLGIDVDFVATITGLSKKRTASLDDWESAWDS